MSTNHYRRSCCIPPTNWSFVIQLLFKIASPVPAGVFVQSHGNGINAISKYSNFYHCPTRGLRGGSLLNLTMCLSRFTLNCLTLLKVSTNIPSGLPVTEAQLARVALAETAACNCLGPCSPSIAFPLDSAGCVYIGLKVVRGCKIGHGKLTEKNHVQQAIVAQSLPADHLLSQSSMLSK